MTRTRYPQTISTALVTVVVVAATVFAGAVAARALGVLGNEDATHDPPRSSVAECHAADAVQVVERGWSIEQARAFDEFALFWVGDEWRGCSVVAILRYEYVTDRAGLVYPQNELTFIYGSCVIRGSDGGCTPPFHVRINPYCQTPPGQAAEVATSGDPFTFRGAKAQYIANHLVLWTQNVAITLSAPTDASMRAMAMALVPVNAPAALTREGQLQPPEPLTCPSPISTGP